jgi:hypothetical protein
MKKKIIYIITILFLFYAKDASPIVFAEMQTQHSILTSGTIANQANLVFSTSFENVEKIRDQELNLSIAHWFYTLDHDHASMEIDSSIAHIGSKCLKLEVTNMMLAQRAEFNIVDLQNLVGQECTIIEWIYLPSDYGFHNYDIDYNWNALFAIGQMVSPWQPYFEFHIYQRDLDIQNFDLGLITRDRDDDIHLLQRTNDFPLPIGRWFKLKVHIDRNNGELDIWVDNILFYSGTGLDFGDTTVWKASLLKIYMNSDEPEIQNIWLDDIRIYEGEI